MRPHEFPPCILIGNWTQHNTVGRSVFSLPIHPTFASAGPSVARRRGVSRDTNRPDEQEICRLWREGYAVKEAGIATEHGMSKFTRRAE